MTDIHSYNFPSISSTTSLKSNSSDEEDNLLSDSISLNNTNSLGNNLKRSHSTLDIGSRVSVLPDLSKVSRFTLDKEFVNKYKLLTPPLGFNGFGLLVYMRTYSRKIMVDGQETNEVWYQTIERVVNGNRNLKKQWFASQNLYWNETKEQKQAQKMFDKMFHLKFLPGGRGLSNMGSDLIEKKQLFASLYNCGFVTTANIANEYVDINFEDPATMPFTWCMDASLVGIGVGFDVLGADKLFIPGVDKTQPTQTFVVPDSREGWIEAFRLTLSSFIRNKAPVILDYSLVRPMGALIKTMGGIASGPAPLDELLKETNRILTHRTGTTLTITDIADIFNMIGRCVVSGGIRRTALLSLGDAESDEYLDLKNYKKNPQREAWGWSSNNSLFGTVGMNYENAVERMKINGEPGIIYLDNMRKYGRMNGKDAESRDKLVVGANPCVEINLEDMELCNLTEVFLNNNTNKEELLDTIKCAFDYGKITTLAPTHWTVTNAKMLKNRRIGVGVTGCAQLEAKVGKQVIKEWLNKGYELLQKYDKELSAELCIRESIKLTCVKPSGTISLLAGASPGLHYVESRFYKRRMRLAVTSPLIRPLKNAGYFIEPDKFSPNTLVVEVPVDAGEGVRTLDEVSMWEQMENAAMYQECWADNSVSATVTFNPETEAHLLVDALKHFETKLKCVSFLPRTSDGAKGYVQPPYEPISEQEYKFQLTKLKPINFNEVNLEKVDETPLRFCDSEQCLIATA